MPVQPNAVRDKAIQYIVLYCLTPARFGRYSSLNLCVPCPARGEKWEAVLCPQVEESVWLTDRAGMISRHQTKFPRSRKAGETWGTQFGFSWQLATGNWPLELMRCSN